MSVPPLDLTTLPLDPMEQRAKILLHGAPERVDAAMRFVREEYEQSALLESCQQFMFYSLLDAPRSTFPALTRMGFFPWIEAAGEVSEALNHALFANYKAVFDSCRRAIEMAVVGVYFQQSRVSEKAGRLWLHSELETPPFTRAMKCLVSNSRFAKLQSECGGVDRIKSTYWGLCDVVHTRGVVRGLRQVHPSHHYINGVFVREISLERLREALDTIVLICRHIALLVALENPVLLIGLDLEAKFGLNGPLSGFFNETQSERLHALIPEDFRDAVQRLASTDDEVHAVREWFDGLPAITEEEWKLQLENAPWLVPTPLSNGTNDHAPDTSDG